MAQSLPTDIIRHIFTFLPQSTPTALAFRHVRLEADNKDVSAFKRIASTEQLSALVREVTVDAGAIRLP